MAWVCPSVHVVQDQLEAEEEVEEEGVALLDQDKEWGGEGREGETEKEQVSDRDDDSRSDEFSGSVRVNVEIETEGTVKVLSEVVRDSLGDQTNMKEPVPLQRRLSVRAGWRLVSPSLDREITEDGEQ